MAEARRSLRENIERHGSSGRYVHLLEAELIKRKLPRRLLLGSLTLNAMLLAALVWSFIHG